MGVRAPYRALCPQQKSASDPLSPSLSLSAPYPPLKNKKLKKINKWNPRNAPGQHGLLIENCPSEAPRLFSGYPECPSLPRGWRLQTSRGDAEGTASRWFWRLADIASQRQNVVTWESEVSRCLDFTYGPISMQYSPYSPTIGSECGGGGQLGQDLQAKQGSILIMQTLPQLA